MVKQIAHIAIEISNLERSLEFYCGALGLEKKFEMKNNDGKVSLVYIKVSEGVFVELFPSGLYMPDRKDYLIGYHHLCFEVEDIHAAAEKVQAHGITLTHPVQMGSDRSWQFWVADPDGNRIEFMQYTPESLQLR